MELRFDAMLYSTWVTKILMLAISNVYGATGSQSLVYTFMLHTICPQHVGCIYGIAHFPEISGASLHTC